MSAVLEQTYVPRQYDYAVENLRPFQKVIFDKRNDRGTGEINCIIDSIGFPLGKSVIVGWMGCHHSDITIHLPPMSNFTDTLKFFAKMLKQHGKDLAKNIFIDFPRAAASTIKKNRMRKFITGVEMISKGLIEFKLNRGQEQITFDLPNIWIFTPFVPDMAYISKEKWKFWTINENFELVEFENST